MDQSILTNTKKLLGIDSEYMEFDQDIIIHINTCFANLHQLGVGPIEGFAIDSDAAEWDSFLGTGPLLNMVKSYVYLRVRLLFDPPTIGSVMTSMENQITKLEWHINLVHENSPAVEGSS